MSIRTIQIYQKNSVFRDPLKPHCNVHNDPIVYADVDFPQEEIDKYTRGLKVNWQVNCTCTNPCITQVTRTGAVYLDREHYQYEIILHP